MSDYSSTYPTQRPTFAFDAKAGKLDSRISYSRSSSGTAFSSERHLSSENLLKNSQDYSSVWANQYITTPTGSQTAPDGSSTAFELTSTSEASAAPTIYQAGINLAATTHTAVVHLKAGTASHGFISIRTSSGNAAYAMVNFSAGTVSNGHFGTVTNSSSTIAALGSDWFKVTLTATTVAATNGFVFIGSSDGTVPASSGYPMWTTSGETIYAWGAQLSSTNSKVYDSPTTTQIAREYAPLLKTASAGDPRFEYDADGQSVGLLIEASASNLQRYGSDFASWSNSANISITPNAAVAPNGLLEADLAVAGPLPISTAKYVYDNSPSVASGSTYTASTYIKSAGQRYVQLLGGGSAFPSSQYATFDLQTGSVDANGVTASASSVGNGWYRIQATFVANATSTAGIAITFVASATSSYLPNFTGNDYDGFLLWGFQLETGSAASSLVDTGTGSSQLSRAADFCSVVDATLFSSGEHTIIWEGDTENGAPRDKRFFALSDGSFDNRFVADYDNGTTTRLRNWADDVNNVGMSTSTVDMLVGSHKLAATLKTNECQLVIDGTRRQVDTYCVVGEGINQLAINSSTTGAGETYNMNGHCKRITYYNVALSQAEAEALTSNP